MSLSDGATFERKLDWVYNYITNTLIPELDGKLDGWFEQYKADHEALLADIQSTKDGWQALFDQFMADIVAQLEALNDQAVANLIRSLESETRGALDQHYKHVVSILEHGGKAEPGFDNQAALQAAIDEVAIFGGTVVLPFGVYEFGSAARMKTGVTVDLMGSLLKLTDDHTYNGIFKYTSMGAQGYGSSAENTCIRNGTIQGNFADGTFVGMTVHHAKNALFEDIVFNQAIGNGHSIDLLGCDGVTIRRCRFQGRMLITGRNYVEAIQVDHSTRGGAGSAIDELLSSYDGLPTINVLVDDCHSEPLTVNNAYYFAPRLVGSHSRLADVLHKNIQVRNSSITDSGITDGDGRYLGWLHFTHTDGLLIDGFEFVNTRADSAVAIGLWGVDTTYPLDSVQTPSPPITTDAGSVSSKNVIIRNIKASGFTATELSPLIRLHGSTENSYLENAVVDGVEVLDGHSGGAPADGIYVISGAYVDGISVSNVVARRVSRGVSFDLSKNIAIDGVVISDWCSVAVRLDGCVNTNTRGVTSRGNNLANISGGSNHVLSALQHVVVGDGAIEYAAAFGVTACRNFSVTGVVLTGAVGSLHEFGIRAYGDATNGTIVGCVVDGITPGISYVNTVNVEAYGNTVA